MMAVIPAVIGLVAFWLLWKELSVKNRPKKLSKVAGAAAVALLAALLLLTATGRLPWLAAVAAGALPFLRWGLSMFAAPLLGHFLRSGGGFNPFARFGGFQQGLGQPSGQAPSVSTVATADLRMTLAHESGEMDGEVLRGPFASRRLADLGQTELAELYAALESADSLQLLAAYMERRFPGWTPDSRADRAGGTRDMDEGQALAVLGLDDAASKDDILAAHRRLMQKLHPDRGGTDYLAATLNKAKDVLLARGRGGERS